MTMGKTGHTITQVEIQEYLSEMDYPTSKQDIIDYVLEHNAPNEVIDLMIRIPDRQYNKPSDVTKAIDNLE